MKLKHIAALAAAAGLLLPLQATAQEAPQKDQTLLGLMPVDATFKVSGALLLTSGSMGNIQPAQTFIPTGITNLRSCMALAFGAAHNPNVISVVTCYPENQATTLPVIFQCARQTSRGSPVACITL
jgi:hypothetical protein